MSKKRHPFEKCSMLSLDLVTQAQKVMSEDAKLLSFTEYTFFWNEADSPVNGRLRDAFNCFVGIECIQPSLLRPNTSTHDFEQVLGKYRAMIVSVRDELSKNPDKKAQVYRIKAAQILFIIILSGAIQCYEM